MDTLLGLLGLIVYIAFVIGLAALVTWLVVWLTPSEKKKKPKPAPAELPPA